MKALTVFVLTVCSAGLAAAAVAPELGYVRLLKGENKFCDGTQCSGGCCPYADFDCCDDGSHCANNVQNCPGCDKVDDGSGNMAGGWCKVHVDDFGEQTEQTPCCTNGEDGTAVQYCVHEDDPELEMYSGSCQDTYDEFCAADEGIKCGKDCCPLGASYVCCPDNICSDDAGVCLDYCGGDVCGPSTGTQECCLQPEECCADGTAVCQPAGSCGDLADGLILCGPSDNTAAACDTSLDPPEMCCPGDYPACYTGEVPTDGSCGGVLCGNSGGIGGGDDVYCLGETPYCCVDGTCAKHVEQCPSDPCDPSVCDDGGTEQCCDELACILAEDTCCLAGDGSSCAAAKPVCCGENNMDPCCDVDTVCCSSTSVAACAATAEECVEAT